MKQVLFEKKSNLFLFFYLPCMNIFVMFKDEQKYFLISDQPLTTFLISDHPLTKPNFKATKVSLSFENVQTQA